MYCWKLQYWQKSIPGSGIGQATESPWWEINSSHYQAVSQLLYCRVWAVLHRLAIGVRMRKASWRSSYTHGMIIWNWIHMQYHYTWNLALKTLFLWNLAAHHGLAASLHQKRVRVVVRIEEKKRLIPIFACSLEEPFPYRITLCTKARYSSRSQCWFRPSWVLFVSIKVPHITIQIQKKYSSNTTCLLAMNRHLIPS